MTIRRGGAVAVATVGAAAALAVGTGDRGGSAAAPGPAAAARVMAIAAPGPGLVPERATGVALRDGLVLTVAHVLDGGRAPSVDGRAARVLRVDARADLALLAVPSLRAPAVRLAPATRAAPAPVAVRVLRGGRPAVVVGAIRRRVVARVHAAAGPAVERPALELAATVLPGDSGAPVLDAAGRLVGVVFARADAVPGRAWAVQAAAARALLAPSRHR